MNNEPSAQAKRPNFAEIARRAYEMYEGKARVDDLEPEDWHAAEAKLDEAEDGEPTSPSPQSDEPVLSLSDSPVSEAAAA